MVYLYNRVHTVVRKDKEQTFELIECAIQDIFLN